MPDLTHRLSQLDDAQRRRLAERLRQSGLLSTPDRADAPATRLAAFVVAGEDASDALTADLRQYVGERLPQYMVPSTFTVLDRIPRIAGGKINRRALPHDSAPPTAGRTARPPSTDLERRLARVWADLLQVDEVGVDEDFFEIGGHSLLAMQLLSRIRDRCDVEVPIQQLFEAPTVAALAAHVEAIQWADASRAARDTHADGPREEGEI